MKSCAFDPSASAVKLLDYQEKEVIVDYDLKIKTERRVKIKIFNEKGFEHASIIIPYISRIKGTRITDITAYIHYQDPQGNIITEKVDKNQIFRDKQDDAIKRIKFTFPNVKPGCVIEYKYEKTEKNYFHLEPWFFQDIIPTEHSAFRLKMPSPIKFEHRLRGVDSITEKTTSEQGWIYAPPVMNRLYSHKNVPAFRPEPLMTSISDNLQRIEFAVQSSSLGVAKEILGDNKWAYYALMFYESPGFGKQFNKPVPGTESIVDSALKMTNKEEKINYIFQRVKQQVKWDDLQTYYPGDITDAWKERNGNSADINLLILNLLRRSGIDCLPVLISTRENGMVDEGFFSLSQFNGIDVLVTDSSNNYFLDGTRKTQSYKIPPANILNRYALSIDTAKVNWIFVSDTRPLLKTTLFVNAELTEKGKLEGNATITFFDHSKVLRLDEKNRTEKEKIEEEKEFIRKDFTELKIDSLVTQFEEDELSPLTETFVFTYEPSSTGEFLFLDPFFLSNFRKNPFTDSSRQTTIDFNSIQLLMTTVNITIPATYEITNLPKNIKMRTADSSILFSRITTVHGNLINFSNKMEVLYPLFEKEGYEALRDFFNRMYGMITEQIILKRK